MKWIHGFAAVMLLAIAGVAGAQKFPERPIRVIVPLPPGSVSYTHLTLPTNREV